MGCALDNAIQKVLNNLGGKANLATRDMRRIQAVATLGLLHGQNDPQLFRAYADLQQLINEDDEMNQSMQELADEDPTVADLLAQVQRNAAFHNANKSKLDLIIDSQSQGEDARDNVEKTVMGFALQFADDTPLQFPTDDPSVELHASLTAVANSIKKHIEAGDDNWTARDYRMGIIKQAEQILVDTRAGKIGNYSDQKRRAVVAYYRKVISNLKSFGASSGQPIPPDEIMADPAVTGSFARVLEGYRTISSTPPAEYDSMREFLHAAAPDLAEQFEGSYQARVQSRISKNLRDRYFIGDEAADKLVRSEVYYAAASLPLLHKLNEDAVDGVRRHLANAQKHLDRFSPVGLLSSPDHQAGFRAHYSNEIAALTRMVDAWDCKTPFRLAVADVFALSASYAQKLIYP